MPIVELARFRGYPIESRGLNWVFPDIGLPVADTWEFRPCGYCGRENTDLGHDGCLGTIPGILNACCGHGVIEEAFVQFSDGFTVEGVKALQLVGREDVTKD